LLDIEACGSRWSVPRRTDIRPCRFGAGVDAACGSPRHPAVIDTDATKGLDRMTASPRTYDPVRFHRGTRGFAAFLTLLNGFVVLGATLFVVPTLPIDSLAATWAVILGTTRRHRPLRRRRRADPRRRWSASLVGYVATIGIGISVFGPWSRHRLSIFGAERATSVGFFLWMIGTYLVAARFAFKPFSFTPQAHRVTVPVAKPAPDARPVTGARKRTVVRPVAAAA
jgi:hypothetical protein